MKKKIQKLKIEILQQSACFLLDQIIYWCLLDAV